ncbi:MAG: pro-sigmaK processing inhibitor BofA [Clostridia bacterium]|nr:pro-sigmaK processing inhibitor BofA [Clostridia bacterium]
MQEILIFISVLVAVVISAWLFTGPLRFVWKIMLNSVLGGLALLVVNYICIPFGINIGINPITCLTCGVLGLPGFALLLILKYIL